MAGTTLPSICNHIWFMNEYFPTPAALLSGACALR
jgi:hypothetical protein